MSEYQVIGMIIGAFVLAGVLSYALTPFVKRFAYKIGAIDVPKDSRRMHKRPIPRLGGLAIFIGFLGAMLVFYRFDMQMLSVLLGAMIIVVLGIFDPLERIPLVGNAFSVIFGIISGVISLLILIFAIVALVNVCRGKEAGVPLAKQFAHRAYGIVEQKVYTNMSQQ